jgi:tetratricopeptide (TPR) repeat protein
VFAWLAEQEGEIKIKNKNEKAKRRDPWSDINNHLVAQPPEILIDLLLEVAHRDDRLYRSLLLKAERTGDLDKVVKTYQMVIDDATYIHDFIDWRAASTFADNIEQIVESLSELLTTDIAASLVELAEYAIERVENALRQIDDSYGDVGGKVEALGELHRKACDMALPEPVRLAERLFRLETSLPFNVCSFDVVTYRDVLGSEGLRRYLELAEAEWSKIKPRDGKAHVDDDYAKRFQITRIMEQIAEANGDVEELVGIKSRDLSSAYRYLAIAEIYAKASQPELALDWAELGLKSFAERPGNHLRDFLVAAYLERKRNDEALELVWIQFEERLVLEHYIKLHDIAVKLDVWAVQRERALMMVDAITPREAARTSHLKSTSSALDHSLRLEIALWENDLDAAWSVAHKSAHNRGLLTALAGKLEASRPVDAVSLYHRVIPTIIDETNNFAYGEAIKLIGKVGSLMKKHKQLLQFEHYLAELRLQFKPKRNFIKLLDGVAGKV